MKNMRKKSGICLQELKSKENQKLPIEGALIFSARVLAVAGFTIALWENFFSVFPISIEKTWFYGGIFLLSMFFVRSTGSRGIGRFFLLLVPVLIVGVCVWKYKQLPAAVTNTLANAFLKVRDRGSVPLLLYEVPVISGIFLTAGLAAVSMPIVLLAAFVVTHKKGKIWVMLLLIAPTVAAVLVGMFPSVKSCGVLVLTAGIYFSICAGTTGKTIWGNAAAAGLVLLVLCMTAGKLGSILERGKTVENGVYVKAQTLVTEQVVQRLESLTKNKDDHANEDKQNQEPKPEETQEPEPEETNQNEAETNPPSVNNQGIQAVVQGNSDMPGGLFPELFAGGGTSDLRNIASFKPGDGEGLTVKTKEKPTQTYYLPLEYGTAYEDSSWKMEKDGSTELQFYGTFPSKLTRLIGLCQEEKIDTVEDAAAFIQKEFEENTVYDYNPGAVSGNQDIAEYFLFENKKGFCVHFATTAALMYRIMGYPARYVEGYAIPASAFTMQQDGSYQAVVTGEMGHAWCETFEGEWNIREHTLPYQGNEADAVPPAYTDADNMRAEITQKALRRVAAAGCVVVLLTVFWGQAAFRRRIRMRQNNSRRTKAGILSIYLTLCEMAGVLGTKIQDPLCSESFRKMQTALPEISKPDWEWIQNIVWETVYGENPPSKVSQEKLLKLWNQVRHSVWKELSFRKKVQYRYMKGLP